MEQILAALIIACSNINQPTYGRESTSSVIKQKKECIYRVNTCAASYSLNLKKNQKIDPLVLSLKCSKEVY